MFYYHKLPRIFIDFLLEDNIPFILYYLPHAEGINLLIQHTSLPKELDKITDLDQQSGFLVAPYPGCPDKIFLVEPDIELTFNEISNEEEFSGELKMIFNKIQQGKSSCKRQINAGEIHATTRTTFINSVENAVAEIENGEFNKVILSRIFVEKKPDGFQPVRLFEDLCRNYAHALVYYWQIPGAGSWMGATPEPVIKEKNGKIYTVSLAGTQLFGDKPLRDVCWKEKEIAEQAIVSRYILQLIDSLGVQDIKIIGPHNFQAGNLVHLNTGFEFNASGIKISRGEFIEKLHPTPSIAGLPKDKAMQFIVKNELHSRSYYAGLLGPYRMQGETHLYVNLRCMQLLTDELVLYSGAGITGSSVPENEWEETNNKLMTLLKVIHA